MRAALLIAALGLALPALGADNPGTTGAAILQVPMSARAIGHAQTGTQIVRIGHSIE